MGDSNERHYSASGLLSSSDQRHLIVYIGFRQKDGTETDETTSSEMQNELLMQIP